MVEIGSWKVDRRLVEDDSRMIIGIFKRTRSGAIISAHRTLIDPTDA